MGALDGLLVVALEQAVAAPMCTVRLADAGARVIKIERSGGETARHYDDDVQGTSAYFAWLNRGKQSAVLDLKSDTGRAVLRAMLARADVLVQNLAPGAMARLGFSEDVLTSDFPQLITASITGYGRDTSYADMRAYDLLVQAESGLCSVTGSAEVPSKVGVSAADIATGLNAHAAVLEALLERGITGRGKAIEIAMFDAMADWMAVPLLHHEHAGKATMRHGLSHASIYPYGPFDCADGTVIIAVQTNEAFRKLACDVALRPDLAQRAEFATNAERVAHRGALDAELAPIFKSLRLSEMIARLTEAGIAFGRYRDVAGLAEHPALRRTLTTLEDGSHAALPRPPGRTSDFAARPVPKLGADTRAIVDEFLGAAVDAPFVP